MDLWEIGIFRYAPLIVATIAAFFRSLGMQPHILEATGDIVLKHGTARKVLVTVFSTYLLALLIIGYVDMLFFTEDYKPDLGDILIAALFWFGIFGGLMWLILRADLAETFGTSYLITRNEVIKKIWSSSVAMNWSDIKLVRYSHSFLTLKRTFTIRNESKEINIEVGRKSGAVIAQAIKDNVQPDKWAPAANAIASLLGSD